MMKKEKKHINWIDVLCIVYLVIAVLWAITGIVWSIVCLPELLR